MEGSSAKPRCICLSKLYVNRHLPGRGDADHVIGDLVVVLIKERDIATAERLGIGLTGPNMLRFPQHKEDADCHDEEVSHAHEVSLPQFHVNKKFVFGHNIFGLGGQVHSESQLETIRLGRLLRMQPGESLHRIFDDIVLCCLFE